MPKEGHLYTIVCWWDESATLEGSSSEEKEGTTWGGEASGATGAAASGAAVGATGWAICKGTANKGAAGSNKGLKRGTGKARQKNMYNRTRQVAIIYIESSTGSKCNCSSSSLVKRTVTS